MAYSISAQKQLSGHSKQDRFIPVGSLFNNLTIIPTTGVLNHTHQHTNANELF